jgi:hypothetical protein
MARHSSPIASSAIVFGSKYSAFLAKLAAAECSIPWSTGKIEW